jgi:hypothetical protein
VVLTASDAVSDKAGGNITFQNTVNAAAEGAQGLGVSTDGATTFAAPVGGTAALKDLAVGGYTTPASGLTDLNAASVTTKVGGQSYANPVVLTASDAVSDKAGGKIDFKSTVDAAAAGGEGLTARTDGTTEFDGFVGGGVPLSYLTVGGYTLPANGTAVFNVASSTTAAPSVTTTGNQTDNNVVQLEQDTVLTSTKGGNVLFNSTVDSLNATAHALTVIATPTAGGAQPNGLTTFQGTVGKNHPLTALAVVAGGPMTISQNITAVNDININVRKSVVPATALTPANDQLTVGPTTNPNVTLTSQSGNVYLRATNSLTLGAASKVSAAKGQVTLEIGYFLNELANPAQAPIAGYNIGSVAPTLQQATATIKGQIVTSQNSIPNNVTGTPIMVNSGTGANANVVNVQLATALLGAPGLMFNGGGGPGANVLDITDPLGSSVPTNVYCVEEANVSPSVAPNVPTVTVFHGTSAGAAYDAKLSYNRYVEKLEIDGNPNVGGVDNVTVHVANIANNSGSNDILKTHDNATALSQIWLNAAPNKGSTLKIDASATTVTQQYAIGAIGNQAVGTLAQDLALSSLTWPGVPHNAPTPTSGAPLAPPLFYPLPQSVPQSFAVNNVALLQYLGGTGTNNCAVNNTSTNSLMVAAGSKGNLIGGLGSNELLGGPGQSQLFGRGALDYVLANYTVNFSSPTKLPNGTLVGTLQALPAAASTGNQNYVFDAPTGPGYSGVVFVGSDRHLTYGDIILPSNGGGLTPTEWLKAVLYFPTSIVKLAQASPLLQVLPGCPNEKIFV